MKYWIKTFGCQMNKSDSERIASVLEKAGYKPAKTLKGADLVVVNMCSVRQSAVDRVLGLALKIKGLKKNAILTGCILEKNKRNLSKNFNLILDIETLPRWPKILKSKKIISGKDLLKDYFKIEPSQTNGFSANVPIMTGCNNYCTYCVVPYARGRERSRPVKEIICEIKKLIKRGYKEIWLLGQNVNSYGRIPFPDLLRRVNEIPGDFWIRFTSSNPKDFSEDLIKAMKECKKATEYLNLPAQSGDNKILKKMNRPYDIKEYREIIKKVRREIPDIALSTDIIVGFPGETKEQLNNTAKLFKEVEFDMAYISKYSARPQTTASELKDNISPKEKTKRKRILNEILKKTALKNNKGYIGKEVQVLIDNKIKGSWTGKTRSYKTVKVNSSKNLLGKFVNVKVTSALPWGLKGEIKSHSE